MALPWAVSPRNRTRLPALSARHHRRICVKPGSPDAHPPSGYRSDGRLGSSPEGFGLRLAPTARTRLYDDGKTWRQRFDMPANGMPSVCRSPLDLQGRVAKLVYKQAEINAVSPM